MTIPEQIITKIKAYQTIIIHRHVNSRSRMRLVRKLVWLK